MEVPLTEASKRPWPFKVAALCVASLPWAFACADEDAKARDLAERLDALDIGIAVKRVAPSEVPGLYELATDAGILYATEDGSHLIAGNVYEIREGGLVNVTERKRAARRRDLLASIDERDLITFTPEGGAQASVTVFTDTDCGFCRQLHGQMPNYHANGIEVRYLAYPRAGVGSPTYDKMVSAWCADDAREALTALKRGEGVPEKYCENHPVSEQYELGQLAGIEGTPAILLPDGQLLPGYVPPDDLAAMLGL
ncbi:MAG: thioredoxin fold domain-containing protein [Gammaproteobacteria bacterium]|nr:thioredoxin fold domain-containing protein [Gammaproteobacteria bacterium]MYF29743.1 thioredoxin fold domain-containing protein [Gammaproteobacteria bacterium]MYK45980.1 thioredoxin fold domain-containing protein [Gammaproteobacteria bacterium]